jgi:hypothetical protein
MINKVLLKLHFHMEVSPSQMPRDSFFRSEWFNNLSQLPQALELASVPDFKTLYRFLQRLDDQTIDRAVGETVRRLRGTRKKILTHPRSARRDTEYFPAMALSPPRFDRKSVQFGETHALGSRARPLAAYAEASGLAARTEFQSVSLETSLPFLEDANRASIILNIL